MPAWLPMAGAPADARVLGLGLALLALALFALAPSPLPLGDDTREPEAFNGAAMLLWVWGEGHQPSELFLICGVHGPTFSHTTTLRTAREAA